MWDPCLELHGDFAGYVVDGINAANDGDVANFFVCKEILRRNCCGSCVDIGADQGAWTAMIHALDSSRKVYVFEPNPISYKQLGANLGKKSGRRMQAFQTAISDISGTLNLNLAGAQSAVTEDASGGVQVTCRRLSEFLEPNEMISVVKIDTEGHDLHVLRGLYDLLEQGRIRSIITEWSPHLYGKTKEECYRHSLEVMERVAEHLPWVYALSRCGSPYVVELVTAEAREEFLQDHLVRKFQTDILFTSKSIESLPVVPFEPGKWYA